MEVIIKGLHKDYGKVVALRDIHLTIGSGMFGLLGPNGAGKTTLMRILATLIPKTKGHVRVGIAQALIGESKLLIVDEPIAGLDSEERIRFRNLLGDISRDQVVILSTHEGGYMATVERDAEEVAS